MQKASGIDWKLHTTLDETDEQGITGTDQTSDGHYKQQ